MKKKSGIISETIFNQKKLLELFLFVVFLAIGLNLISDGIPILFNIDSLTKVFLGIVLCLFAICYAIIRTLINRKQLQNYTAFFIYDGEKNSIIEVPHYRFSTDMTQIMNAAFSEDNKLKKIWDDAPLRKSFPSLMTEKSTIKTNSINFINELTEYLILKRLSNHLNKHFNHKGFSKDELKTYGRSDIPEILLKNRFLELISHPISERPSFHYEDDDGMLVSSYGNGGSLFDKFDPVLPKNSIIQKPTANEIFIETDKLKLFIKTDFQGLNSFLPPDFTKNYLNFDFVKMTRLEIRPYIIHIDVQIEMKFFSLFSQSGWEYYEWVDSFIEDLDNYLSEDTFFKNINWATARTILHCLEKKEE